MSARRLPTLFLSQEVPVNIRFCLEGMEESGSEGLDDLIFARKDTFFKDVDYICISDNYWLGKKKPCITYGLRGICYFFIEVPCRARRGSPHAIVRLFPAASRVGGYQDAPQA